jgi:hypothetical protein
MRRTAVRCAIAILGIAMPGLAGAVPVLGPTGNYYEIIATPMTWEDARAAALATSWLGEQGYLATVTSAQENVFVAGLLTGASASAATTWSTRASPRVAQSGHVSTSVAPA